MDLYELKAGDRVRTIDGNLVQIINETEDGEWILIRYIEGTDDLALVGTDDLCHLDELRLEDHQSEPISPVTTD